MKKFLWLSVVALSTMLSLNLFAGDAEIFSATTKEVDLGGHSLIYQKINRLDEFVQNLLTVAATQIAANPNINEIQKQKANIGIEGLKVFAKGANLGQVKAFAASAKKVDDLIISKSFLYTQNTPNKLAYGVLGSANKNLTDGIKYIPDDVIYGFVSEVDLTPVINELSKDPMASQFLQLFEIQFGISANMLSSSTNGIMTLTFDVSQVNDSISFDMYLRIPDKDGALSKVLMTVFNTENSRISIPMEDEFSEMGINPTVYFDRGYVVIATNDGTYQKAQKSSSKNILDNKDMQKYINNMSKMATTKVFINLNQKKIALLNNLLAEEALDNMGSDDEAYTAYSEVVITEQGYKATTVVSDSFDLFD